MTYDDLLRKVHGDSFEKRMFIVYFLNGIPNALFIASMVLVMYLPESYRCTLPERASTFIHENPTSENVTLNYFIPYDNETRERSKCTRYNRSIDDISLFLHNLKSRNVSMIAADNTTIISCDHGHTFDNPMGIRSIAMEFDWTCENNWMKPTVMTIYLVGKSIATATGFLSDRFGRRIVFIASNFFLFGVAFFQSFSTSTLMYAVVSFFSGLASLVNFIAGFVLGAECTIPERRNIISLSSFISYALGYVFATVIFYISPDWRWCLRIYGLLGIFYISNFWLVPESPRWLMAKGRIEEAKKVFKKIAQCNNKSNSVIDKLFEDIEKESVILTQKSNDHPRRKQIKMRDVMKSIFKSPPMIALVFAASYSWFSVAMVYYGISFSSHALFGNIYINNSLVGLVEFPGYFIGYIAVKYMSRPISHGGSMIISGLLCLCVAFLSQVSPMAATIAGLVGKASISSALYIVYIHTAEVFPTIVRNTYMGWGSFSGRIGSILSPYFIYMIDLYGLYSPYVAMSLITICSGILTILIFPETLDVELPETVEDTLRLKKLYTSCCTRSNRKKLKIVKDEDTLMSQKI